MPSIDDSELRESFLMEAEENINILNVGIHGLESSAEDLSAIDEIFRAAHTIKGVAALLSYSSVSNIAHHMEDILEEIKERKYPVTSSVTNALLYMLDAITGIVRDISEGRGETMGIDKTILKNVEELLKKTPDFAFSAVAPASAEYPDSVPIETPSADIVKLGRRKDDLEFSVGNFVRIGTQKIEEMLNLIGETTIKKNHLLEMSKDIDKIMEEVLNVGKKLNTEVNRFSESHIYDLPSIVRYADSAFAEFGELEFDRYDMLNIFSRKVQETVEDMSEALKEMNGIYGRLDEEVKSIDSLISLLMANLSETRMVRIDGLFQRFVRRVRELAKQYGKEVIFQIKSGETAIDRVIFEKLFDPFMHILRNCVWHGIEDVDERLKKGKLREGLISVSAKKEGNSIAIEISDDGRGIDIDGIFTEGVSLGLWRSDDKPSKDAILSTIFTPGLSTVQNVDMTSGRGVGMDIVKRQISRVNGIIEISTEAGKGTKFRIKLPTSFVISNVIVINQGDCEIVMPVNFVEEIISFDESQIREDKTIEHRDATVYVKFLSDIFGQSDEENKLRKVMIICNISDKKIGLVVDKVIGNEDTIIKPLNHFIEGLTQYSGITISGYGKVRMVLNPVAIFEEEIKLPIVPPSVQSYEGKRILVIDDSLSVRKYVYTFLESIGLKAYTASNGVEALGVLDETAIDLIITDLEMPIMHGFELIKNIRLSNRLKKIPIIVLTSRATDKHRDKVLEIGADGYLPKPFEDSLMLEQLRKFLPALK
ncbi:MAG: response regulator [Nitrospirae bacterium]|nr:response regulator [Nitrospirota bacterium]